jgi:dTDP-4-dehydrorhamnose reductase
MLLELAPAAMRLRAPARTELDLARPQTIARSLSPRPDLVINAAAFTAVDRAEVTPDAAFAVNRDGAAALARHCAAEGIPLIHFSTDYVFDGEKPTAYVEADSAAPLNVYGRSKLEGEEAVRAALPRHVILRCSWVFGPFRQNFVRSILERAARGERLRVVADQRGCPTATSAIAAAIFAIVGRVVEGGDVPWGTYHFAGREPVTWFEFARAVVTAARPWIPSVDVEAITSADLANRARRPRNSALDCSLFARRFGLDAPSWRPSLDAAIARMAPGLVSAQARSNQV